MQLQNATNMTRALRLWQAATGVMAILAVAGGVMALQQKRMAIAQKEQVQAALAQSDYLQAAALISQEKYNEALPYLAHSLRMKPHANPAASLAFDLMMRQPVLLAFMRGDPGNSGIKADFSPDGKEVMATSGQTVQLWDLQMGRLVAPPIQHPHSVTRSIFSPDGSRVATLSQDDHYGANPETAARVWNAKTGEAITPSLPVKYEINLLGFSPDGRQLLALSSQTDYGADGRGAIKEAAQAWDAETGRSILLPFLQDSTTSFTFSPDGTLVATTSGGAVPTVWNMATGKPLQPPLQTGKSAMNISQVEFSPDSARLMTIADDVRVWDLKTGLALTGSLPLDYNVCSAGFSPNGDRIQIISGFSDEHSDEISIKAWEIKTGQPWGQPPKTTSPISYFLTATFSPDGTRVATASSDDEGQIWDAQTGKAITPPLKHDNSVVSTLFSPDGERVVTASLDRTARVWDARNGEPLTLPLPHEDTVRTAQFSPDGAKVLTTSDDGTARVWDARTGRSPVAWFEHGSCPSQIYFSPDGTRELAIAQGNLQIWDVNANRALSLPFQHGKSIWSVAFSPDATRVVTVSDDKTARVWDMQTGQPVTPPIPVGEFAGCPVFSPDGSRVFIGCDTATTGRIFNAQNGQAIGSPMNLGDFVVCAVFSQDGKRLTTVTNILDNTVQTWDAQTGQPAMALIKLGETKTGFTELSPDGTRILSSVGNWFANILDTQTGQPVTPPLRHQGPVVEGAFSQDGTRVATGSYDGTIRIWDAKTGQLLAPPIAPKDGGGSFALSPDGRRLVVTASHSIQVWDCTTSQPLTAPLVLGSESISVRSASFSPDGLHVRVEMDNDSIRMPDLAPVSDPPLWFSDLIEASAFSRLNPLGVAETVPTEKILEMRRERLASTSNDRWEIFGRWLFSDPTERTVSPWSPLAMPEYVQGLISYNQPDSLKLAMALSYGHPDWQAQARAKLLANWPDEQ